MISSYVMHYDWIKINAYSYILGIPLALCDYKE